MMRIQTRKITQTTPIVVEDNLGDDTVDTDCDVIGEFNKTLGRFKALYDKDIQLWIVQNTTRGRETCLHRR